MTNRLFIMVFLFFSSLRRLAAGWCASRVWRLDRSERTRSKDFWLRKGLKRDEGGCSATDLIQANPVEAPAGPCSGPSKSLSPLIILGVPTNLKAPRTCSGPASTPAAAYISDESGRVVRQPKSQPQTSLPRAERDFLNDISCCQFQLYPALSIYLPLRVLALPFLPLLLYLVSYPQFRYTLQLENRGHIVSSSLDCGSASLGIWRKEQQEDRSIVLIHPFPHVRRLASIYVKERCRA